MIRFIPLLLLLGCGWGSSEPAAQKGAQQARRQPPAAKAKEPPEPPRPRLVQGILRAKGDGLEVTPCHGGAPTTVLDEPGLVTPLLKEIGDPLYVEARAIKDDGGIFHVRTLNRAMSGEGDRCKAIDWTWTASGTEPFWSVVVQGSRGSFHQPDPPPHADLKLDEPVTDAAGVTVIQGKTAPDAKVVLRFEPKPCRDAMSGAWSSHTVTAEIGGRKLSGCGWPGEPEL